MTDGKSRAWILTHLFIAEINKEEHWLEEWEYPPIGVYLATDPSGGHALFALDYRECGKDGEPKVVLVEQEWDFEIVELAPDFETFIRSLRHEDEFIDEEI